MSAYRWQTMLGLSACLVCSWPADAQDISGRVVVHGRVEDATSRAPIAGAQVLSADSAVVAYADSLGSFVIALQADEPIAVYATQFGYLSQRFDVGDVAPSRVVVLRLEPSPFEIEGLTVEAETALTRLLGGIEERRNAYPYAMTHLDRTRLERYGLSATVRDVLRARAPRIRDCSRNATQLCTPGRFATLRGAYPQGGVLVCIDEMKSFSPAMELSNMSIGSVALVEVFAANVVRIYTVDWMLHRARLGQTSVYPAWMGC